MDLSITELESLTPLQIASRFSLAEIQEERTFAGTDYAQGFPHFFDNLALAETILKRAQETKDDDVRILCHAVLLNHTQTVERITKWRDSYMERGDEPKMLAIMNSVLAILQPQEQPA